MVRSLNSEGISYVGYAFVNVYCSMQPLRRTQFEKEKRRIWSFSPNDLETRNSPLRRLNILPYDILLLRPSLRLLARMPFDPRRQGDLLSLIRNQTKIRYAYKILPERPYGRRRAHKFVFPPNAKVFLIPLTHKTTW